MDKPFDDAAFKLYLAKWAERLGIPPQPAPLYTPQGYRVVYDFGEATPC